ncbi:mucin-12 isoform X1 [Synchiropus splendidus]|uniref:mucin-12 isoform X1 n=1 Tax=Synchiropus splendidus TaxID=270530 RepID=UPI00237E8E6D|nr:mucin-12 isoform X1 [Synchiropus splendidus]
MMFARDAAAAAAALELRAGTEAATPPSRKDALTSTEGHESASHWHRPLFSRYEATHTAASLGADRLRRCRSVDASFFPVHQPVRARPSLIFLSLLSSEEDTKPLRPATSQRADTEAHCSQVDGQVSPPDTSAAQQNVTSYFPDWAFSPSTVQADDDLKTDSEEPCDSSMLSSTMATVLAPHFGRRTQRFDSQGNMQDGTKVQTSPSREFQGTQRSVGRMFSNASQDQLRSRRSTVDWSSSSGPVSLNSSTKSYTLQSIPTGVSSEATVNRNKVGSARPEIRSSSIMSSVDRKNTEQISSLGSKPTTSSLLLSLRRMNSNRSGTSSASEVQPPTQSSSPQTENGKIFKTLLSHTLSSPSQERFNPTSSSSSGTHQTSETGAPSAWSSSSTDKVADRSTQRISQTQSRFLASRQAFMEGRAYSSLQERADVGKELSKSSPRDSVNGVKTVPLKTTLSESSAGWRQHSYDSPPLGINDANALKKHDLVSSNNIYNLSSSGLTNSKRPANEVINNGPSCKTTYSFNLSTIKKSSLELEKKPKEVKSEGLQAHQNLPDLLVSSKITSTSAQAPNMTFRKPSLTLDLSSSFTPGRAQGSPPYQMSPVSPPRNNPSPSFPGSGSRQTTSPSPIGFERSYASMPKPFQSDAGSKISHTVDIMSKRNYTPRHSTSLFSTKSLQGAPVSPNPSALSPPPANTLHLLTPPSTPVSPTPSYSDTSSPKEGRACSSGVEKSTEKPEKVELTKEKKKRRVTWEDSVENSKPVSDERLDTSSRSPQSPTRSPRGINAPSIFSFLRTNSPTSHSPPASTPSPRISSMQLGKKDKYRSFSSDSADVLSSDNRSRHRFSDTVDLGQRRQEAVGVHSRSTEALSLPPDFLSGYKVRYSSPPYSTLVSTRSIQGEGKRPTPRSPLFKEEPQSNYTGQNRYILSHRAEDLSSPKSGPRQSTAKAASYSDGFNSDGSNHSGPLLLVDNRLQVGPKDKQAHGSSSCVTETLVYSVNTKANNSITRSTKPDLLPDTFISPASSSANCERETQKDSGVALSHSGSRLADDVSPGQNQRTAVMGKNRLPSLEDNKEQNPKKSRFVLRKSASAPNSHLSRSDSDRSNKTNSKMTVLSKLKQTFSTRRSEEDPLFPWRFKRSSQPPSLSGLSDTSTSSESAESNKTPHKGKECVNKEKENERERNDGWIQKRYSNPVSLKSTKESQQFSLAPDSGVEDGGQVPQNLSEERTRANWTTSLSTSLQIEGGNGDITASNSLSQPGKDAGLSISPVHSQLATSPRSPFSPFPSLSPLSPHSPPDAIDDNVFYSPKLRRRKDSLSPREPREGISLGGATRSRLSTGPPSAASGNTDCLTSSYADLKYGIEPGRSVSVSSVLSSRPSGPGRISTGSRVMSVGDLTAPSLSCRRSSRDSDQWALYPSWTTDLSDSALAYSQDDASQMRSRSLPRSLTRRLANWGSELSGPPPPLTTSKSAGLWSPSLNICQFTWDTEAPPTPPPTPPPATRRMSKPSSSNSPVSPGESQDSPPPRGRLPSRGYISSLSSFQESSESGSDTTTDDEYYLETDEERETEL